MISRSPYSILAILIALLLSGPTAYAGSISGKIVYDGVVPKLRPIKMDADPACTRQHSQPVPSEVLVLGDGKTLANIFVQVGNPPSGRHEPPKEPVILDQKGCLYVPRVVGVMAGQTLEFRNSDGTLHNVHGQPVANSKFNVGMPPALKSLDRTFTKPEPIFPVKCDIHPWMKAYVAVMDHPYFHVTGTTGTFKINDLPPGTYEIQAWHERLGSQSTRVTVGAGDSHVDFIFRRPDQ